MTTITDELMTSDVTSHTATKTAMENSADAWVVSWLPGRALTRNKAITAMTLAEAVNGDDEHWYRLHAFVADWAAELDLTGPDAERLAMDPA